MKKRIVSVGLAVVAAATLLAAGCGEGKNYIKMSYYDETSYAEGADYSTINENLFYRNERKVDVADPCVVYVDDEKDADYGSYYLYGTTGNTGFFCWKSDDLVNWEGVGYALLYRDLSTPQGKAVSVDSWAPEVIYDGEADKWYMFFSSTPKDSSNKMKEFRLVVWAMHGIYGAGKTLDETFGLIETVEKAAQIYMLTAHLPRVNTIKDEDMLKLLELFGVKNYRRDFLDLK